MFQIYELIINLVSLLLMIQSSKLYIIFLFLLKNLWRKQDKSDAIFDKMPTFHDRITISIVK